MKEYCIKNKKMKPSKLILLFLILQISSKKTELKDEKTNIFLINTNLTKQKIKTLFKWKLNWIMMI